MKTVFDFAHLAAWLQEHAGITADTIYLDAHVRPQPAPVERGASALAGALAGALAPQHVYTTAEWLRIHREALKRGYVQPAVGEEGGPAPYEVRSDIRISKYVLDSTRIDLLPKIGEQAARQLAEELLKRGYLRGVLHGEDPDTLYLRYYLHVAPPQAQGLDWAAYFSKFPHLASYR